MSIWSFIGVSDVLAAEAPTAATQTGGGLLSLLPLLIGFFLISYFLIIRPQNKRIKAQRKLLAELTKGDEVVTAGGLLGKIVKITDDFIVLSIADNVDIQIQKAAISNVLPKGTIKSITS